jgi:Kef-type K+ transport system membrane component KefB
MGCSWLPIVIILMICILSISYHDDSVNTDTLLATLLLDLGLVAGCALALGALARRFGQPAVVGEIVAGLLLGPSVLGQLPGNLDTLLFGTDVRSHLQLLANVGLVLFMFGVGYEIDVERMRHRAPRAGRIAASSVLVPFAAGAAIAPLLWARHPPPGAAVTATQFGAFLGIALSITALPVLARVLAETQLAHSALGSLALVVAGMTDLVAWTTLGLLIATLGAASNAIPVGAQLAGIAAFPVVLAVVVRPLLRRGLAGPWCERHGPAGAGLLLLAALGLCAAATTWLGLHPVFGAFALGVACPRRCAAVDDGAGWRPDRARAAPGGGAAGDPGESEPACPDRVGPAVATLASAGLVLVPLYFVVTGLQVDVTSLAARDVLELAGLLVVATAAKVTGATWAAARSGMARGSSLGLGLLLNTRGLTELIALGIGHDAGILDGRLFTELVLVALLTTAMTMPLLSHALRFGRQRARRAGARMHAAGLSG